MTTTLTTPRPAPRDAAATHAATPGVGTAHLRWPVLTAEWTKLRTLRANAVTVAIALGSSVALSVLAVAGQRQSWATATAQERADFDPVSLALVGVILTTLVIGSVAVRAMTSEHSTGMVRTTFIAMPHRLRVLLAKTGLVVLVGVAVGLVADVVAFVLAQRILAPTGMEAGLGDPGVVRAIVFGALGVGLFAAIAISLGTLVRRATTANILLALLVVGGQLIGTALPEDARRYLPSAALQALVTTNPTGETLAPGAALAVLGVTAVSMVTLAGRAITRRDP
jgi:ABC-2 type transport system permease protein